MMQLAEKNHLFIGRAGHIETLVNEPAQINASRGIALVAHPHPLFGGSNTNKVVHTLAKVFTRMNFITLRPNFRGVGKSTGNHDHGEGETDDLIDLLQQAADIYGDQPIILSGFSFGAYVQTRVFKFLSNAGKPVQRVILVGTAAGQVNGAPRHYIPENIPKDSILIHGSKDITVPLSNILDWAEPQELPVIVIPGSDHFFHGKLHIIRNIVSNAIKIQDQELL